ncbi:MAG: ABC transporter ATP-binding protein [Rhodanobacteraceae bacterium]|nr:ABC transporter ATP-binding protein [Rhodanobacteraceae bacterium]
MIEVTRLSKVFRTDEVETTAVDNIDFVVREGEFVALMGPSGCGKSTLMHIIGLLDSPSSGSYRFLGDEVAQLSERRRAGIRKHNIGFIFQSFNLIDELSVYENVELPLVYAGVAPAERRTRVAAVLTKLKMEHRSKHYPLQLSGGQQQRVAVARALVSAPKLILADEPTGNLDSRHGEEVMDTLRQLNREGSTIVMVTHSEHDASYCDRVQRLLDGKLVGAH